MNEHVAKMFYVNESNKIYFLNITQIDTSRFAIF